MWPPGQGRWTGLGAKAGECRGPLRNRAYLTAGSARRLALAGCREPHRHVLDAVDEIGPEPADLAAKRDGGHPLGQGLQQHPQLERRQVPAEAVVRAAAAEADMGVRVAPDVELLRPAKTSSSRFAEVRKATTLSPSA